MQIVPYTFYLYTVFHSVIYNSVTKGYETAVPENIQTDSALYWIEHNLTLCSALSCPVKNLIVFANVQKNANNVVAYVFMSKKQFDQSKELPETENIILKCPEKWLRKIKYSCYWSPVSNTEALPISLITQVQQSIQIVTWYLIWIKTLQYSTGYRLVECQGQIRRMDFIASLQCKSRT